MSSATVSHPFSVEPLLAYFRARAMDGVEEVSETHYRRSIRHGSFIGIIEVDLRKAAGDKVVDISCLPRHAGIGAYCGDLVRDLIDGDAPAEHIMEDLGCDPLLARHLAHHPGIRIPGTVDPFELSVRAVLGQQISVAGASRLASRIVERWGEPLLHPWGTLSRLFPMPEDLAEAPLEEVGLSRGRAGAIRSLAAAITTGSLRLDGGADHVGAERALLAIKGIGPWTASYISLRALRNRDAMPVGDLGLRQAAGCQTSNELARLAERWQPWRGYAATLLWSSFLQLPRVRAG